MCHFRYTKEIHFSLDLNEKKYKIKKDKGMKFAFLLSWTNNSIIGVFEVGGYHFVSERNPSLTCVTTIATAELFITR